MKKLLWGLFIVLFGGALVLLGLAMFHPPTMEWLTQLAYVGGTHEGKSTREWARALDSESVEDRREAIKALGIIGKDAKRAIPKLAKIMLEDPDLDSRVRATHALIGMDPESKVAVKELVKALDDPIPDIRMNSALALFRLRGEAKPAVDVLLKGAVDPKNDTNLEQFHFTIQEQMILTLGRSNHDSQEVVDFLVTTMKKAQTNSLKSKCAQALGATGPKAKSAVPALNEELKKTKSVALTEAAEEAISLIEGTPLVVRDPPKATKQDIAAYKGGMKAGPGKGGPQPKKEESSEQPKSKEQYEVGPMPREQKKP